MSTIKVNDLALAAVEAPAKLFLTDLEALPPEAFNQSFGPACRTVADIVYEVNMVNDHVTLGIRGEEQFPWPYDVEFITAPEGFGDKEQVIAAFRKSIETVIATIGGLTDAQLLEPYEEEGRVSDRYERCRFMSLHLWYHLGQLNFIQTILGDKKVHWH